MFDVFQMFQRKFWDEVLELLAWPYQGLHTPDYINVCQRLAYLDKLNEVTSVLDRLIKNGSLQSEAMVGVNKYLFYLFIDMYIYIYFFWVSVTAKGNKIIEENPARFCCAHKEYRISIMKINLVVQVSWHSPFERVQVIAWDSSIVDSLFVHQ